MTLCMSDFYKVMYNEVIQYFPSYNRHMLDSTYRPFSYYIDYHDYAIGTAGEFCGFCSRRQQENKKQVVALLHDNSPRFQVQESVINPIREWFTCMHHKVSHLGNDLMKTQTNKQR